MQKVKLCIAGKNNIAVDVLAYVLQRGIYQPEEVVVVCNRTEDGANGWQKSLRYFAKRWDVKEVSLEDVYPLKNIVFLSLEFDCIIHPERFQTSYLYNIHLSALPKYKGMYTSVMPILNHEQEAGVTFHKIDSGIDTGAIVEQTIFPLKAKDTAHDLYLKFIHYGTRLVCRMIDRMQGEGPDLASTPQDKWKATYYSRKAIDFSQVNIDLQQTAVDIACQLRAFNFREYQLPKVFDTPIVYSEITENPSREKPGTVLWSDENRWMIATIDYNMVLYADRFADVMQAAEQGDWETLQRIPCLSLYTRQAGQNGWTPLMVAAYYGNYDMAMLFISLGADIWQTNWNGTNLLMYAKDGWKENGDVRLLKYLQKQGMTAEMQDYRGISLKEYCERDKVQLPE